MRRQEEGFTLIELIIVLVILGILAAVAIPRFENFSQDAKDAATAGGRSSVSSAIAIEIAKNKTLLPSGSSVATRLPGSSCVAGGAATDSYIKIAGTGSAYVAVTLISDGATAFAISTCAIASIAASGTGSYTTG